MKVLRLSFTIFLFVFAVMADNKGEVKIVGYGLGEFAIKGQIEQQLSQDVVASIKEHLHPSEQLIIAIRGSADKTGRSPENDELARKRAEEAKNFLGAEFPEAKVTAYSAGDESGQREVMVSWTIVSPKSATLKSEQVPVIKTIFVLIVFFLLGFVILKRRKTKEIQGPIPLVSVPQTAQVDDFVEAVWESDGKTYIVPLKYEGGKFVSPLPYSSDPGNEAVVMRKTRGNIKSAVRKCLGDPAFRSKIEKIIAQGIIWEEKTTRRMV